MSSNSGSSISTSQERGSWGRGFPLKCQCGLDVVIYPSASQSNPGRPFFRCPTKKTDHLFKWVEDGVYEEVVDSLPKFSIIENAIHNAKSEAAVEIQDLQAMIKELKEEALWSKRKIKKCFCSPSFVYCFLFFSPLALPFLS
ncbi:putative transcription factor GRF family [Arabidopsis thaliana]